jgi:DNA-binding response OmpR family regulator
MLRIFFPPYKCSGMLSAINSRMKENFETSLSIILLVEDEESLRRSITFTMMRLGYRVIALGSIEDALGLLKDYNNRDEQIILIITDLQFPGKSGLELVRRAKTSRENIPILVITGHNSREIRAELDRFGVVDVLDKPFDLDELVTKVQTILQDRLPGTNDNLQS